MAVYIRLLQFLLGYLDLIIKVSRASVSTVSLVNGVESSPVYVSWEPPQAVMLAVKPSTKNKATIEIRIFSLSIKLLTTQMFSGLTSVIKLIKMV